MTEPLLVRNHPCRHGDNDNVHGQCNTRRRHSRCSNNNRSLPSPDLSTSFIYLRPTFLLAGCLFGAVMELAYLQSIRLGMVTLVVEDHHTPQSDTTTNYSTSIRMETWTDILFYEMSFSYADFVVLLYLFILTRHALKRTLNMSLPISVANWMVGMVLGLAAAVASVIGPKVVMQEHIGKALGCMVAGVALCFVAYYTALEMEKQFISEPPLSSGSDDKAEQDTQSDVCDPRTMISLTEAHIV